MSRLKIDRIAIIGAGPGGLAAAKYLLAERKFSRIDIFEQRSMPGGVWNFTSNSTLDTNFTIPRTRPSQKVDEPVFDDGGTEPVFVSPIYDSLETNIPHTLMSYSDQPFPEGSSLFPKYQAVTSYLEEYARELSSYLNLSTQVINAVPAMCDNVEKWSVTTRNFISKEETTTIYDAIICANGHYSDPFIPNIPGLKEFDDAHPGIISHSKYYRRPDRYENKRVVIVGNSASGIDLSTQISNVSNGPVLVSEKVVPATFTADLDENKQFVPEIVEFLAKEQGVRFANGRVETSIDSVVFCTGYQYSFPFLNSLDPPLVTTGQRTENVYEHIFYHPRPTLAFLGLPQRIVPLPTSEAQAGYVARVFSGRLSLPSQESMREWEANNVSTQGESKLFHNLAFPKDAAYINRLYDWCMAADLNADLDNGGRGKIPPYWGEEKQWARERFPIIKIANRKLGARRHEVRTLEELGFDFHKWKAENATEAEVDSVVEVKGVQKNAPRLDKSGLVITAASSA